MPLALILMFGFGLMVIFGAGLFLEKAIPWALQQWIDFVLYCHNWSSHAFPDNFTAGFYNALILRTDEVGTALLIPHWWKIGGVLFSLLLLTAWLSTKEFRFAGRICMFALLVPVLFSSAWHFGQVKYQDLLAKISPEEFRRETGIRAQAELESWMRCAAPDAQISETLNALEKSGWIALISPENEWQAKNYGKRWNVAGFKLWGVDVHHIELHEFSPTHAQKAIDLKITLGAAGDDTVKLASQMNITEYGVGWDLSKLDGARTWRLSKPISKDEIASAARKKQAPYDAPVMSCTRVLSLN